MTTIDPAEVDVVADLLHRVDATKQALSGANSALEAAENADEHVWQVCLEALCRAGDDYENAQLDSAEAMLEGFDDPAADDEG
jgi:hypothetical protein